MRRHSITFFNFYAADGNDQHSQLVRENLFEDVVCCPIELPAPGGFSDCLHYAGNLLTGLPYAVGKYRRSEIRNKLENLARSRPYDVLLCDFVAGGINFPWLSPLTKVIFTHNVEAMIWKRHYEVARNPLWKAVFWREWRTMSKLETEYLRRSDHVLTVSECDKEQFSHVISGAKITAIPTGVDAEYFSPALEQEQPDNITFVGSMDWLANEDAAFYFCDHILPGIQQSVPQAQFWIVGRRPSSRLQRELGGRPGVHITGGVDDIRPYLRGATVVVVPLRVGGGTRLKIFEAMSCQKAVVSTSIGAEGLPVLSGKDIVLCDDPGDFAHKVTELLRDSRQRSEIARQARQLVETKYSWHSVAECLESVLERAAMVREVRPEA